MQVQMEPIEELAYVVHQDSTSFVKYGYHSRLRGVVNQHLEVVDVTLPLILQNIICLVKSGGSVFTSIVCGSVVTGQGIVQIPTQI